MFNLKCFFISQTFVLATKWKFVGKMKILIELNKPEPRFPHLIQSG